MAKSKKAGKLPKRIAGAKLPKALRNSGKKLAGSPFMREIFAGALVAAGAALLKSDGVRKSAKAVKIKADEAARRGAILAASAGGKARNKFAKGDSQDEPSGAAKHKERPATA